MEPRGQKLTMIIVLDHAVGAFYCCYCFWFVTHDLDN